MARFFVGLVCLTMAALQLAAALGFLFARLMPSLTPYPFWPFVLLGLALLVTGLLFWRSAWLGAPATEELFEGERGLLLALMLVSVVLLVGFVGVMVVQADFWRGLLDGLGD